MPRANPDYAGITKAAQAISRAEVQENDNLTDRAKTMLGTLRYAQFHRKSPAYPDDVLEKTIGELVEALESAQSHKSLPPGMVWQDYYSPDDVLKIREPLDAEIERLRAGGPRVERVETVRALQESHHGGCICDCNPETTNGPDEYCSHHGRPYYEVVDRLTAKIEQLIQERLTFTDKLGYGDGVTEPAAELADLLDPIKAAFSEAGVTYPCHVVNLAAPATPEEREIESKADARRDALFAAALVYQGNGTEASADWLNGQVTALADGLAEWLAGGQ